MFTTTALTPHAVAPLRSFTPRTVPFHLRGGLGEAASGITALAHLIVKDCNREIRLIGIRDIAPGMLRNGRE